MNNDLERMIFGPDKPASSTKPREQVAEPVLIAPPQSPIIDLPMRPIPRFDEVPEFDAGGEHTCKASKSLKIDSKTGLPWVCEARIPFPGICKQCANESTRREFWEELGPAFATIPEHYWWTKNGSEFPFFEKAVKNWAVAKEELRKALATDKNIVIMGGARRGKTSLAGLAIYWVIRQGKFDSCSPETIAEWRRSGTLPTQVTVARYAKFVSVALLKEQTPATLALRDEAITGTFVVLDDFGAELDSAPLGSGWVTSRITLSKSVVERRINRKQGIGESTSNKAKSNGKRTLTTLGFPRETIAAFYGDGVAGRLFEDAYIIDLGWWPEGGES